MSNCKKVLKTIGIEILVKTHVVVWCENISLNLFKTIQSLGKFCYWKIKVKIVLIFNVEQFDKTMNILNH